MSERAPRVLPIEPEETGMIKRNLEDGELRERPFGEDVLRVIRNSGSFRANVVAIPPFFKGR